MHRIALGFVSLCLIATPAIAQSAPAPTDLYHVLFAKAALGQAKALEAELSKPDPKSPMPGHQIVLKHQDGDDWDYAVIEHLGKKFTVDPGNYSAPAPGTPATMAWHTDTIVLGPSWEEFTKQMGDGGVDVLATWRAAPGHRQDLLKELTNRGSDSKVQTGDVTMAHVEGGPWQYLTLAHYKSWQDYATDEAATQDSQNWYTIRDHGAWHHDTLTTRVASATK